MQPQYEIFFVDPFDTIIQPFIVTAAFFFKRHNVPPSMPAAECFVVIPGQPLFGQRTFFNSFGGTIVDMEDGKFLLRDAKEQAKQRVRQYIFEKYQSRELIEPFRTPDLLPIDNELGILSLAQYWIRNLCHEVIEKMSKDTLCETLEADLIRLMQLPKIVQQEIK